MHERFVCGYKYCLKMPGPLADAAPLVNIFGTNLYPNMRIVTPGSVLRARTPDDAESPARHADNPRIAAMMRDGFPSPYTSADACRFIEAVMHTALHLYLAIAVCGEAVGGIGVQPLDDVGHRTAATKNSVTLDLIVYACFGSEGTGR